MTETAPVLTSAPGSAGGRRRRDARDEYLRIARELAGADGVDAPSRHFAVAHVSIAAVARAAGVSRGALYRLWPSQQEFWSDLVDHLLGSTSRSSAARDAAGIADPSTDPHQSSMPAVIDAAQEVLLTDPLPLLRAAVVSYPEPAGTDRGRGFRERRGGHVTRLDRHLRRELRMGDARCVDGLTATDLAAAATAIGNGLPITGRMTPPHELSFDSPAFDVDPGEPRSLLGVTTHAIHAVLTEPGSATMTFEASGEGPSPRELHPSSASTTSDGPGAAVREMERPHLSAVHDVDDDAGAGHQPPGRREHYLHIAASLALGAHTSDSHLHVLGHVTLDTLARAADVTRRTLTNVWPDQAQFRLDLFSHLLERERSWVKDAIIETTLDVETRSGAVSDAFAALGDRIHQEVTSHLDEITFLAYAPQLDQRDVSRRATQDHDGHLDDGAVLLRQLLSVVDRRPRAGVTLRQLAIILFTIADGTNRLARTHRTLVRDEIRSRGDTHSITGYAVAAVLDSLTEPLDTRTRVIQLTALLS